MRIQRFDGALKALLQAPAFTARCRSLPPLELQRAVRVRQATLI